MSSYIGQEGVEALLSSQGCANSLKTLYDNREISSVSTEPLINNILYFLSLALSSIDSPNPPPHHESSFQSMASHKSRRSSKRKIYGAEGLEINIADSPAPRPSDGFIWRKYGQKIITNSPHPRCYYKCVYAKDLKCNAKKKVQKIKDRPLYRTIYVGQHTCVAAFAINDDTYGSKMIQFDQIVSESVMSQLTTIDHQALTMEDKDTDHIMNEFDVNDFLVDDDQFWANQSLPFPSGDLMFPENPVAFD